MRLEPTISTLTAIRSIQMAKRDSDGYRIRKYFTLKSILFIMFANLKLALRSYPSLYGIFMSASLTLYIYKFVNMFVSVFIFNKAGIFFFVFFFIIWDGFLFISMYHYLVVLYRDRSNDITGIIPSRERYDLQN